MKKLKKLVVLFAAALLMVLPVLSQPLTAQASNPTTWYLKYVDSIDQWRFQKGTWDEVNGYHRELYYMHQDIKDGDIIVIDGNHHIDLEVSVRLSNLTILNPDTSVVTAASIDNFYAGGDGSSAINCDVTNAFVYEKCSVNFNKNAAYIEVIGKEGPQANVAGIGTIGQVKGWDGTNVSYEIFNVAAGKLRIQSGKLTTDAADYSTTASGTPASGSTAATTTPSTTTTSSGSSAAEYDDVPKTGDSLINPLWFLAIAAVCIAGCWKLERR